MEILHYGQVHIEEMRAPNLVLALVSPSIDSRTKLRSSEARIRERVSRANDRAANGGPDLGAIRRAENVRLIRD